MGFRHDGARLFGRGHLAAETEVRGNFTYREGGFDAVKTSFHRTGPER